MHPLAIPSDRLGFCALFVWSHLWVKLQVALRTDRLTDRLTGTPTDLKEIWMDGLLQVIETSKAEKYIVANYSFRSLRAFQPLLRPSQPHLRASETPLGSSKHPPVSWGGGCRKEIDRGLYGQTRIGGCTDRRAYSYQCLGQLVIDV